MQKAVQNFERLFYFGKSLFALLDFLTAALSDSCRYLFYLDKKGTFRL